ncbi:hypothetical protein QVG61_02540 [Thiohalobacter sp. IOR34]|uniref:hypothetical protein n=1 Tax=Thiohalobacter sp. IOR34 TaxID=3057176 RepID=UPI0025B20486|nr:hypothetical protein [Thiohalobacter sp. IOR34]WJW75988.1 hypothetical protein QVG61_02540 [Thiohalobacter sp. IOR34]
MNDEQRGVALFQAQPAGQGSFPAQRRYHSLMQIDYTPLILPCWTKKESQQNPLGSC